MTPGTGNTFSDCERSWIRKKTPFFFQRYPHHAEYLLNNCFGFHLAQVMITSDQLDDFCFVQRLLPIYQRHSVATGRQRQATFPLLNPASLN